MTGALGRRGSLRAMAAGLAPLALPRPALGRDGRAAPRRPVLRASARPGGGGRPQGPFHAEDFAMVGVFDTDRLLNMMAASPGAFRSVRAFGVLNSGERE